VFSFMIFILSPDNISDQQLMYPIQFQTDLIFLDFPDGIFWGKIDEQWRGASPCFTPFWIWILCVPIH
jgi:hypothetical protein